MIRRCVLLAAATALSGCNSIFDIESPVHRDGGAATGSGATGSGATGSGGGGGSGGLDTTNMVKVAAGSFKFGNPAGPGTKATLTRDFYVDLDEVTVSRFDAWVTAGQPAPCGGASCSLDPGGPYEATMQWDATWSSYVASTAYGDSGMCTTAMGFMNPPITWSAGDGAFPINCVTWYHAAAFCAFEGKRLLTETEWEYVTGYGHPSDPYPWGTEPADCDYATWNEGNVDGMNGCEFPKKVGAATAGYSQLGLRDASGSVFEWAWDWQNAYPMTDVTDYAGAAEADEPAMPSRITRGGSWAAADTFLDVHERDHTYVTGTYGDIGIRCAGTAP